MSVMMIEGRSMAGKTYLVKNIFKQLQEEYKTLNNKNPLKFYVLTSYPDEWNITNDPDRNNYSDEQTEKGFVWIDRGNTLDIYDKSSSKPIIITEKVPDTIKYNNDGSVKSVQEHKPKIVKKTDAYHQNLDKILAELKDQPIKIPKILYIDDVTTNVKNNNGDPELIELATQGRHHHIQLILGCHGMTVFFRPFKRYLTDVIVCQINDLTDVKNYYKQYLEAYLKKRYYDPESKEIKVYSFDDFMDYMTKFFNQDFYNKIQFSFPLASHTNLEITELPKDNQKIYTGNSIIYLK